MTFEAILPLVLKVLGCAVAIYFIAGFLVSCTRLLPFLTILASAGTIWAVSYARGTGDMAWIWLPVVLSILMQLFYKGRSFMNPKVHENVWQLVSVERKWNSFFADFDDYELHFSPLETGGFIENTIFNGVFFYFYYYFLLFMADSWIVYIFPIYIIGMSLIDILMAINIFHPSNFIYAATRVLILMIAAAIGFLGPFQIFSGPKSDAAIYKTCVKLAEIDYTTSYQVDWAFWTPKGQSSWQEYDERHFIYDSNLNVGAEFDTGSWGTRYNNVYTASQSHGDGISRFNNPGGLDFDFKYVAKVEEVGGAFKYSTVDSTVDFIQYSKLDRQKYNNLAGPINRDPSGETLWFLYGTNSDDTYDSENNPRYTVKYVYNTDASQNPVSLNYIELEFYINSVNKETWRYTPIHGSTGLEQLFDESNNLKGYTYNPSEVGANDVKVNVFNKLNSTTGSLEMYDFKVHETSNGVIKSYLYDSETGMTAVYINRYEETFYVRGDNFAEHKPDYYVSNADYSMYDGDYNLIGTAAPSEFSLFTFDNAAASSAITKAFMTAYSNADVTVQLRPAYGDFEDVYVTVNQYNEALDTNVQYRLFLLLSRTGRGSFEAITATFTYEGREYQITTSLETDDYTISVTDSL